MSVDSLRESRKGATVIFTIITRMKEKYGNSLFCCFEGDDSKYYFKRIEDSTGFSPANIVSLACGGKAEVLRLYNMIKIKSEYKMVKFLYFIDRDFDPEAKEKDGVLYETPVYSVENFYTTLDAFIRIIKCEFNYTETDEEYELLIKLYLDRQKEFHQKTMYFNAWLACQRDHSSKGATTRLNLNNFSLNRIVSKIGLDDIESAYNKTTLEALFPSAVHLTDVEIEEKIAYFGQFDLQRIFRGKFEIDFLFEFLEAIKLGYKSSDSRLKKKEGVHLNQSKRNMIAEFSQYASTPSCLSTYLGNFKIA